MRFLETGPNIPDTLLERCDRGNVVFLCGAGVSIPSGMPDFIKLTRYVVEYFDPPEDSATVRAFAPWLDDKYDGRRMPLDQIFNLLHHEYGREEVNALVAECLSNSKSSKPSHEHSLIVRISSDLEGRPQIITTNFDHLFDNCPGITKDRIFEPPAFPDIELGMSVHGVIHLHGRLREQDDPHHDYILSSADFGRAYLAEGWATKFIRALLDKYTVVLIGYQAEDPPVDYLLQGLNYDRKRDRSNLYSFDKGAFEDIEVKWRDQGITPIAYNEYDDLWKTLEAWANRVDDPRVWRNGVVTMANRNPRDLRPFERGQVAHLVRSTPGARLFAQSEPSPPVEWLCVFDANCRASGKSQSFEANGVEFDPIETYRLDDDPEHRHEAEQHGAHIHDQLIAWRHGDTNPPTGHSLAGRQIDGQENMPSRLLYLLNWSSKHLNDPCLAWWAAKYPKLHPRHIAEIRRQIGAMSNLHPNARRTWNLILEAMAVKHNSAWDNSSFDLSARIKSEGWTVGALRSFDEIMRPILSHEAPDGIAKARPPLRSWDDVPMNEIANWKITFPDHCDENLNIPNCVLLEVFQIAERHLRRAADFHHDIGTSYFTALTCYPDREVDGMITNSDEKAYFQWFVGLIIRMSERHAKQLRLHALTWNHRDQFYFLKLKLFVFNDPQIFEANEAAELVLEFGQKDFWAYGVRRELLFFLADRWADFTDEIKVAMAERLLAGPEKMENWSDEAFPRKRDELAAIYARCLELKGCQFTEEQSFQLAELRQHILGWTDAWATRVVVIPGVHNERPGAVNRRRNLANTSVDEQIEHTKVKIALDFRDHTGIADFIDLVKYKPHNALAYLSRAKKQNDFPVDLWRSLIDNWPDNASTKLGQVFFRLLSSLPRETMRDLASPLAIRVGAELKQLYTDDRNLAWITFDAVISGIASYGVSAVSCLIERLVDTIDLSRIPRACGIPNEFKTRLEYLLATPSESRNHIIESIAYKIDKLHYLEPDWVLNQIIPLFDFGHPAAKAAWNGYLSATVFQPQEIGERLKPKLLKIFPEIQNRKWERRLATSATSVIISLSIYRQENPDGPNVNETRKCIREMSENNRQDAIFCLRKIGKQEEDGWNQYVIPFIRKTWPRERKFRTTEITFAWLNLLKTTKDDFPAVLKSLRHFLVPIEQRNNWLYPFARNVADGIPLASKHPTAVLEMLDLIIPNNPQTAPFDLDWILNLIEDADPTLARDRRYLRLIDLVEQG